ncbi:MAG: TlpA family protein disulfide reductase, partial [Gemmatimonadaceae bacterium]
MNARHRSAITALFVLVLAAAVLILGVRNRALGERNRGLVRRFTEPHPGMLVPSFAAASVRGDSIVVGDMSDDTRQVVFFFTTTCSYCKASLQKLIALDSSLKSARTTNNELLMVGLDSAAAVRRYADSLRLPMPVLLMPNQRLALLYRVRAVPQLMILDSTGRAVYTRAGALVTQASLDSVLAA